MTLYKENIGRLRQESSGDGRFGAERTSLPTGTGPYLEGLPPVSDRDRRCFALFRHMATEPYGC
jgi:hypothetical protein